MVTPGFTVKHPGLQSTLQDWPGRVGYWRVGIPPSGPMDSLAFRIANRLVGNKPGSTALEFQFIGPKLECLEHISVAIVGGTTKLTVDDQPVQMSTVFHLSPGQTLDCGNLTVGARAYLAVAGGFAKEEFLGSAATFPRGRIGGGPLERGDQLQLRSPEVRNEGNRLNQQDGLIAETDPIVIDVTAGPHFDWLSAKGQNALLGATWRVSARSDRTGIRLDGPTLDFAKRAIEKAPENGTDPSNVINTGYPIGGVNICGNTPIILPADGPSQGGFITPVVVTSAALRDVGQLRPNQNIRLRRVSLDYAIASRRDQDVLVDTIEIEAAS